MSVSLHNKITMKLSFLNKESHTGLSLRSRSSVSSIRQFCNDHKLKVKWSESHPALAAVRAEHTWAFVCWYLYYCCSKIAWLTLVRYSSIAQARAEWKPNNILCDRPSARPECKIKQTLWWEDGIILSFYFEAFRISFLTRSVQAVVPSPVRRLNVFSAV